MGDWKFLRCNFSENETAKSATKESAENPMQSTIEYSLDKGLVPSL